jgi:predicted SAM-dependent methyltransferase
MNRLDWGCAFEKHEGWVGSDLLDYGQEHVGDLLDGLPWSDCRFDMIVANHSLQAIRFDDLPRALAELRRVLKVGGVLRILVPDAEWAIRQYGEEADCFPISPEIEPTADGRFLRYLFWHGDARSAFTFESLADALNRNGFQNVRWCKFGQTFSDYPEIVSSTPGRRSRSWSRRRGEAWHCRPHGFWRSWISDAGADVHAQARPDHAHR